MAKTIAECRNRALTKIGKLPLGQTPAAALANDMKDAYDQIYARLEARGLVTWSSTASIPDEFVEDVVALMAYERSEGIPDSRFLRIREAASTAAGNIAATINGQWTNPREYTDY
jgi:hypothetical protein